MSTTLQYERVQRGAELEPELELLHPCWEHILETSRARRTAMLLNLRTNPPQGYIAYPSRLSRELATLGYPQNIQPRRAFVIRGSRVENAPRTSTELVTSSRVQEGLSKDCKVEYDDICAVCKEGLKSTGDAPSIITGCWHVYHTDCISRWLLIKSTCPLCRFDVSASVSGNGGAKRRRTD